VTSAFSLSVSQMTKFCPGRSMCSMCSMSFVDLTNKITPTTAARRQGAKFVFVPGTHGTHRHGPILAQSRLQPGRAWNLRRRSSPSRPRPPRPLAASELLSMSPRYSSVPLRCHLQAGGNCRAGIDRDFLEFFGISSEARS